MFRLRSYRQCCVSFQRIQYLCYTTHVLSGFHFLFHISAKSISVLHDTYTLRVSLPVPYFSEFNICITRHMYSQGFTSCSIFQRIQYLCYTTHVLSGFHFLFHISANSLSVLHDTCTLRVSLLFHLFMSHLFKCIECSFGRLIRRPGSFLESLIGRQCGSPRQTEGHSFGDHLISAVLRHHVLQKLPDIVLCSVSLWLV
jgi:hypothetical protein